jgi:hypothetical protein
MWMVRVARLHHEMHKIALIDRRERSEVDDWLVRQESVRSQCTGQEFDPLAVHQPSLTSA